MHRRRTSQIKTVRDVRFFRGPPHHVSRRPPFSTASRGSAGRDSFQPALATAEADRGRGDRLGPRRSPASSNRSRLGGPAICRLGGRLGSGGDARIAALGRGRRKIGSAGRRTVGPRRRSGPLDRRTRFHAGVVRTDPPQLRRRGGRQPTRRVVADPQTDVGAIGRRCGGPDADHGVEADHRRGGTLDAGRRRDDAGRSPSRP